MPRKHDPRLDLCVVNIMESGHATMRCICMLQKCCRRRALLSCMIHALQSLQSGAARHMRVDLSNMWETPTKMHVITALQKTSS